MDEIASRIDWIVVEEAISKYIERRLRSNITSLLPVWSHPLTQKGIVNPATDVNQVSVLINKTSGKVNWDIHARICVTCDPAKR